MRRVYQTSLLEGVGQLVTRLDIRLSCWLSIQVEQSSVTVRLQGSWLPTSGGSLHPHVFPHERGFAILGLGLGLGLGGR